MSSKPANSHITRRWAILGLMVLGGCGFTPVYGDGGAGNALRGTVSFSAPDTVAGYRLRERLEERLGEHTAPHYTLKVDLTADKRPATINASGDTTRFNLVGSARWSLVDDGTGFQGGSGTVQTFTSYSATGSTVATQAAATDADARLSIALADLIVARLIMLAPDLAQ